jgi:hypothetical protein
LTDLLHGKVYGSRMRISRPFVAVVALGLIAGCGSDSADSKAESGANGQQTSALGEPITSDAPANGSEVLGAGYTVRVPKGWDDNTAWYFETTGIKSDKFYRAAEPTPPSKYSQNVAIVLAPVKEGEFDSAEAALVDFEGQVAETKKNPAVKRASVVGRVNVDGTPGVRITIDYGDAKGEKFFLYRGNQVVIVNFGLAVENTPESATDLVSSVLATWKWDAD